MALESADVNASPSPRMEEVVERLRAAYPEARCELEHGDAFELLIATILSAQCTDERVNQVTRALFARFPGPREIAEADRSALEELVRPTGYFRNKAKSIQACSQHLVDHFGGVVPQTLEELVQLPGVGRKTANLVAGVAFQSPTGIVVDTHVSRVAQRLGFTTQKTGDKVERDLLAIVARQDWIAFSLSVILHGRRVCKARRPDCERCALSGCCPRVGIPNDSGENG